MAYETVTILDASGNPVDIVVDTLADGSVVQVIRADLGVDTSQAPVSGTIPVSASSLPLPSGAATAALQSTGNASLSTLAGTVGSGKVNVNIASGSATGTQYTEGDTDASISGSAIMWEDTSDTLRAVSASKPLPTVLTTGSAAVGKLAANSGVDIGDVDVTSVTPGTTATSLGKAEDAGHSTGDVGVMVLAVRKDTIAVSSGTTGDYEPLQTDESGLLRVAARLRDSSDEDISFAAPAVLSATPTLSISPAYSDNDAMGTVMTFSDAATIPVGTGHIVRATFYDFDDLTHDSTNGVYRADFFKDTVTVTDNAAYAVSNDTQAGYYIGSVWTSDGTWVDLGPAKVCTVTLKLPMPYACASTSLFAVLVAVEGDSNVSSASGRRLDIHVLKD